MLTLNPKRNVLGFEKDAVNYIYWKLVMNLLLSPKISITFYWKPSDSLSFNNWYVRTWFLSNLRLCTFITKGHKVGYNKIKVKTYKTMTQKQSKAAKTTLIKKAGARHKIP